ncbi:MAG: HAD family hydrolase [Chloroflexota bacterium]
MPPIQVVTLDLWQTLIIDRQEWGRERTRLRIGGTVDALCDAGEPATEAQVREAYRACYRACTAVRQEGRDVSFKEQVQIFVRCIADGLLERISRDTFARILNRYADSFFESPPALVEGVPDMLSTLKDKGYRLGIISNPGQTPGRLVRAYLEDLDIIHYFDHATFSDEVRLSKPAPAIFLHTLASMGCLAEQVVHVGDHLRDDVLGAQQVGIATVWVKGFDSSTVDVTPTVTIESIAELPGALEMLVGT